MHYSTFRRIVERLTILVLIISLILGFSLSAAAEESIPSLTTSLVSVQPSDIQGNWAEPQITAWLDKGIVHGYPDGTFKPDSSITRAEFVTMTNQAFGFSASVPMQYTEVHTSDWYAGEIAKAQAAGYV
ncbi:MAG: S-layer homology domain-containing protein, partial [Firmicutes bacterium]|nr:S-layer homology domain-containing protein [Bacillota bacterium]